MYTLDNNIQLFVNFTTVLIFNDITAYLDDLTVNFSGLAICLNSFNIELNITIHFNTVSGPTSNVTIHIAHRVITDMVHRLAYILCNLRLHVSTLATLCLHEILILASLELRRRRVSQLAQIGLILVISMREM
ncbi:hypothetical protein DVH05_021895 [Phytophthora capsici]|nr:hypothetical protein DVH05_021895 [Phytophthora capsici]